MDELAKGIAKQAWNSLAPEFRFTDAGADRLLGFAEAAVIVASDGLDLSTKLQVERAFRAAFNESWVANGTGSEPQITVYFRKREQAENSGSNAGPREVNSKSGPFGLKVDKRAIPGVRKVIAVASGKGGVGKSTVATNLAVGLANRGCRVGLLDADIYGPSAPIMLGIKGEMSVAPGGRLVPRDAFGVKTVSFGFLSDAMHPVIWRGPMVAKALEQLFYSVEWGDLDYLVIDLPPGTGDVQLTLAERLPLHGAIIVTTPQDVALIDAHKALTMFQKLGVPVLGMVENMAAMTCPKCGHCEDVFGDDGFAAFSAARSIPVLARIPLQRAIRQAADRGEPPAAAGFGIGLPYLAIADFVIKSN